MKMQIGSILSVLAVVGTAAAQGLPEVGTNPTLIQTEIVSPRFAPFIEAAANRDGAHVVLQADTVFNGDSKTWTVVNGGGDEPDQVGPVTEIRIFGNKCLDVPNGNDVDGQKLQIWTCFDNANQQWTVNGDGTIHWVGHNKCVDLTDGNLNNGTRLQIWTCAENNINQAFGYIPPR